MTDPTPTPVPAPPRTVLPPAINEAVGVTTFGLLGAFLGSWWWLW